MNLSVDLIDRDPEQPRMVFDDAAIEDLAASMAASGQAVAILVRPVGGRYVIVHGERRWRAAQRLGWRDLRAEVQDVATSDVPWLALVENVQRADLTPIEEAHAYQKMIEAGSTQSEIGRRLGKTQSFIAQKLRLLRLPGVVQDLVTAGSLTEGHGRQLLRLAYDGHDRSATLQQFAEKAVAGGWSVKRLKLQVDHQQMVHDGYWLMPIDDRWKFKDLVDLEKSGECTGGDLLQLQRRLGMILNWTEQIWNASGESLVQWLLKEAPLAEVYWFTKQCAEWDRKLRPDVDLIAWLRYIFAFSEIDQVPERFETMCASLPEDFELDAFRAAWVDLINQVDLEFPVLWDQYVGSMSRDIVAA
jgi:ParB/RepB/Spo0J family partition protein